MIADKNILVNSYFDLYNRNRKNYGVKEMTHSSELEEIAGTERTFIFRSGSPALDLVNTEAVKRGKRQDLLKDGADLEKWWAEVNLEHKLPLVKIGKSQTGSADNPAFFFNRELLEQVKKLRQALRNIFGAKVSQEAINPADLAVLNQNLQLGNFWLEEIAGNFAGGYRVANPADELLFQVSLAAYNLLTSQESNRLHRCHNGRCILFFYDNTKSATRQWCSLGCMNRARSSENYRLRKQAGQN